mgnify:CR=1 FL=1
MLEVTNNKFALYCERMLNKTGKGSYLSTNFTFAIVYQLEKIADEFKYIFDYISENKIKLSSGTIMLYEKISEMFNLCHRIYYDFDKNSADLLTAERKNIIVASEKLFKAVNKNEAKIISNIVNVTQFIFNILGCIISLSFHTDLKPAVKGE